MELYVETLTGVAFELRVSPYETIIDVKAKIQKFEGIPISQQHLLWKSVELEDDYCLIDYRITNGSTLQLVLSMRCGPINTKRVAHEECTSEVSEYIDLNNKGGLLKKLPLTDKPVTYLVFRDGNRLNLYRLFRDESSTTETIVSKPMLGQSCNNKHGNSSDADGENEVTMKKMETLKAKLSSRMDRHKGNSWQFQYSREVANDRKKLNLNEVSHLKHSKMTSLPPVLRTDKDRKSNKLESRDRTRENQVALQSICSNKNNVESKDNVYAEAKKHVKIGDRYAQKAECATSDRQEDRLKEVLPSYGKDISRSKLLREPCDSKRQSVVARNHVDDITVNKVLAPEFISPKTFHSLPKSSEAPKVRDSLGRIDELGRLPDVSYNTKIQNKDTAKCAICNKKLGLSNVFDCRCGRVFCSRHRYAEVHNCSFDYKSDGRKTLEEKNPAITAPKLPKI